MTEVVLLFFLLVLQVRKRKARRDNGKGVSSQATSLNFLVKASEASPSW
jgi:hypothetical protein